MRNFGSYLEYVDIKTSLFTLVLAIAITAVLRVVAMAAGLDYESKYMIFGFGFMSLQLSIMMIRRRIKIPSLIFSGVAVVTIMLILKVSGVMPIGAQEEEELERFYKDTPSLHSAYADDMFDGLYVSEGERKMLLETWLSNKPKYITKD